MKKKLYIILGVLVVLFAFVIILSPKINRKIDWTLSFNERSTKPYGLKVFYKELSYIFNDKKIRTVYYTPGNYFSANSDYGNGDHVAQGNYINIGSVHDLDYYSIEELLYFVADGNTALLSDFTMPKMLKDSLYFETNSIVNSDSISTVSISSRFSNGPKIEIDKNKNDYYFEKLDDYNSEVLGSVHNDGKERPNFIKLLYGDGSFYIHLQPKAFTNYHLLKEDSYTYTEAILSKLPDANLYYDSFYKYKTRYSSNAEKKTDYGWFWEQSAFRWAWYLAFILLLLFMIFNAKRRQRVIPIIKPLQNTSVAFVRTIANLYQETGDYKRLVQMKVTYFLEQLRTDYNIETDELDSDFENLLHLKSGKKMEVIIPLFKYINWLKNKDNFGENNLLKLNELIEDFYKK